MALSRRELMAAAAAAGAARFLTPGPLVSSKPKFRFVHFTDLHVQPELRAQQGVSAAVKKLLTLSPRPDFVLLGGDHVMDLLAVTGQRANIQFDLLTEALKPLEMPLYSTIGNHDIYGWSKTSPATESDPLYGKRMFEEKFAKRPTSSSFHHKGWDFVVIDSIQPFDGRDWHGSVDDGQLGWLTNKLPLLNGRRTVILTHVPLFSVYAQISNGTTVAASDKLLVGNAKEVQAILQKNQVRAVLQGHTHVIDSAQYAGTEYVTGGAVCGNWWRGWNLGIHPEGFMVYDVDGDDLRHEYVTYGWKAEAA